MHAWQLFLISSEVAGVAALGATGSIERSMQANMVSRTRKFDGDRNICEQEV